MTVVDGTTALSAPQLRPLVVVQSVRNLDRSPDPTRNPYIDLLVDSLPPDVQVVQFSWRVALVGRYDVFHGHWPESLIRASSWPVRLLEYVLFLALVLRFRLGRVGVVQTVHNDRPHEQRSLVEKWLLGAYHRCVDVQVDLNPVVPADAGAASRVHIPHGDYSSWLAQYERLSPERGQLCYFGMIRPYKNVTALIRALREIDDPDIRLTIAGSPASAALREELQLAGKQDARVQLALRHVSDADLVALVSRSELVVLPYQYMKNTGAGLYALTVGRPILVPRTAETTQLRNEFGPEWVHLYDGPLSGTSIRAALEAVPADLESRSPDLSGRNWADHGIRYHEAFCVARDLARRRRH